MNKNEINWDKSPTNFKEPFKESDLEIFEGDFETKINKIVDFINEKIKRNIWTNEKIKEKFAKRNAEEILTDGDTFYMNPCTDLSLVAFALLKKNGLHPTLVAETLKQDLYDFVGMHFAIEFVNEKNELYFLEFESLNNVILKKGEYRHDKPGIHTLNIQRIKDKDIDFKQNMPSFLEENNFDVTNFKLEPIVAQLQKDNVPQTYEYYLSRMKNDGNLILNKQLD